MFWLRSLWASTTTSTARRTEFLFLCCVLDTGAWKNRKTRIWRFVAKKPFVIGIISVGCVVAVGVATLLVTIIYKRKS